MWINWRVSVVLHRYQRVSPQILGHTDCFKNKYRAVKGRFAACKPERCSGILTPEQRFGTLTPEQRFGILTPEQRFGIQAPEQRSGILTK